MRLEKTRLSLEWDRRPLKKPSKLRVAWTAGRLFGRQALRPGNGTSDRDLALGELLTTQLDEMKGLAMKIGQIVSYMGVPLSEPVQSTLARLQTGERGMDPEIARAAVEYGLGAPLETLFDEFEIKPIAAASIGQVHRAQLGGQQVAVKVQYPDVAGTFNRDLSTVGRFASLASFASAVDGAAIVNELALRLEEECDYAREARMQQGFARAFSDDPQVLVPAVVPKRSSATILTSTWVDGDGFDKFCAVADASQRDAAAATIVRFSYRSLFQFAAIQADPHPGNFIFLSGGRVAFLDFGCVRAFDVVFVELLRQLARSVRDHDRSAFRSTAIDLGVVGRPTRFDFDHFFKVMEHLHRPLIAERFRFTDEYVKEGYTYNGPTSPNARSLSIPSPYVWVMRLQWGLWSILAKLGAEGSFAGLFDELLSHPVEPLPVTET
jgi:predicted unusual protein kinase regulating ubiquinone biosynthesis (AarF/ABC1/UbiB family)